MIIYRTAPHSDLDKDRDGIVNLTSAEKLQYPKIPWFYYLGKTADGYAYATTKDDKLPDPSLITPIQMADRLDQLTDTPYIYGRDIQIKNIALRLRKIVAAFNPDAHLPEGPLPTGSVPAKVSMAPFNNGALCNGAAWFGASTGDGKYNGSGWPRDSDMRVMCDLGVKAIRLPIRFQYCYKSDGTLNQWVVNELAARIKYNMSRKVVTVLDAHEYRLFTETPLIVHSWLRLVLAIEAIIGGPTPLFGIELMNEPGRGDKTLAKWTEPARATIKGLRIGGYQGYIFLGAGDWNNMVFLKNALLEVESTGGRIAMDPYDRTIYTGHDYWNKDADPNKTRNDQGSAVDGTIDIANRYAPTIEVARRIGVKVVMSEIGGGISPTGPLPAFNGIGKNGLQLQEEYFSFSRANADTLIGSWFWMGGKAATGYRHKIEAGNQHTLHLQGGLWNV